MSAYQNFKHAKLAVEYTTSMLSKGSSNKPLEVFINPDLRLAETMGRVRAARQVAGRFKGMGGMPAGSKDELQMMPRYRMSAQTAKAAKAGNCSECAAVAFFFLHDIHRVKRLDLMSYAKPGDHVWVVIGRAANSKTSDYTTWGDEAVVCDPWADAAFAASELPSKLPRYKDWAKHGYASRMVTGN